MSPRAQMLLEEFEAKLLAEEGIKLGPNALEVVKAACEVFASAYDRLEKIEQSLP